MVIFGHFAPDRDFGTYHNLFLGVKISLEQLSYPLLKLVHTNISQVLDYTGSVTKVMLKTLDLRAGIIHKIKRMPRERVTTLTLTEQRKLLVSNIVIIQSPKREPLVSNIVLIQSPKREPLVSNIVIILRKKAAVRVHLALNRDNMCSKTS